MAFNQAVVLSAILCCAVAFPDFLFPNLKALKSNALEGRRIKRALQLQVRELSSDQKCEKLAAAFQNVVTSIQTYVPADQIADARESILQTTGMDINNPDHIRAEACRYSGVSNLAELAEQVGIPEAIMREVYPSFVDSIQMIRGMLRDAVHTDYMPAEYKIPLTACLQLYDVIAEIGMLDLE